MATGDLKLNPTQQRLADLLRANPDMTRPVDLKKAFNHEYNKRVGHKDVRTVLENRDAILASSTDEDEEDEEDEEASAQEIQLQHTTTSTVEEPSAFVPPLLMDTIADVANVAHKAGGFPNARDVANIVDMVGGVPNFLMALDLLEKIPSQPQVPIRTD